MASPNQILGKATITVDGKRVAFKQGSCVVTPGMGERKEEMGDNGPEGFTEKAGAWKVKFTVFAKAGYTATQLWNWIDTTVLVEGDNGYSATLVQCTTLKIGDITAAEGTGWEVEMFAMRGNEANS